MFCVRLSNVITDRQFCHCFNILRRKRNINKILLSKRYSVYLNIALTYL